MSQQASLRSATSLGLAGYPIAANLPRIGSSLEVIGPDPSPQGPQGTRGIARLRSECARFLRWQHHQRNQLLDQKALRMRGERWR